MDETTTDSETAGITNTGTVYTASQNGPGYVGAMGPNSRGSVYANGGQVPSQTELLELVGQLRELLDQHADQVGDPEEVSAAIDILEDEVQDGAVPEKVKRASRLVVALTRPIEAFTALVAKILDMVDRLRA